MCGISGIIGARLDKTDLIQKMIAIQHHRGPDANGSYHSSDGLVALGHNRLSIIDLSDAGQQPMSDPTGRYWLIFNGEIYNYVELRRELTALGDRFATQTDSEVLLAAYIRWGESCLDRLIGMFAFAIWDQRTKTLFAARDRFGVKPFYYAWLSPDVFVFASEIKALHAAGVQQQPDPITWATYLSYGVYDHNERTFWEGVTSLSPGHFLRWQDGGIRILKWYDLPDRVVEGQESRPLQDIKDEYRALLEESVKLRFRADVPVGINLSGGVDSSTLLGLVHAVQGADSEVSAFTFITGDERYDELPWVQQMLERTRHPHHICTLTPEEVPDLAARVQYQQDEPFGGFPTLAYSKIFERARSLGVIVLLDGQGMDEQWAGYEYYRRALNKTESFSSDLGLGPVQGSRSRSVRPECLLPDFRALSVPLNAPKIFADPLKNMQYRDARYTKIPRALRFNDRVSMMHSTEDREPFLDHRLFELALSQKADRKIRQDTQKWLLREITDDLLPDGVVEAPKRPLQTPQREWLRGELKSWAEAYIIKASQSYGNLWLDSHLIQQEWQRYLKGESDNSFYIWQWVSLGLSLELP
jgi:asparagine synthase (glutamine-hydrolysing)